LESGSRILDFGCGSGLFLEFLIAKGYKAYGFDKSKKLTKHLRDLHIPSYARVSKIPNGYFDAITNFDVIEHTTKPHIFIRNVNRKLKREGILMITTPNAYGISGRILKDRWWVFGPKAHFTLFSSESLKYLLHREGFKVQCITTDTITPWFMPVHNLWFKILNKAIYMFFCHSKITYIVNI